MADTSYLIGIELKGTDEIVRLLSQLNVLITDPWEKRYVEELLFNDNEPLFEMEQIVINKNKIVMSIEPTAKFLRIWSEVVKFKCQ
jgi:hypothetical protein